MLRFLMCVAILAAITLSPIGAIFAAMLVGGIWSKVIVLIGLSVLA
ncbi:hypothetical protein [Bradyrhizobium sp. SZCCHNR3118]|nr:hypothetical protein [Bradyrhizobium sp. SZCCHNR3118]